MKFTLLQTTASLALLSQPVLSAYIDSLISPRTNSSSSLDARSGCYQSDCPDTYFGFDIISSWSHNFAWLSSLRWRGECGCSAFAVTDAGCKTFTICTGTHSVCLDWRQNRGHWVDPSGVKRCYSLQNDYTCNRKKWQVWPTAEVDCTW